MIFFTQNVLIDIDINIDIFKIVLIDIDIFKKVLFDIDIDISNIVLIDIDSDIDIFQNGLIDIDIFNIVLIDIDIDIDIFQKCRYIDNRYFISIYRTGLKNTLPATDLVFLFSHPKPQNSPHMSLH